MTPILGKRKRRERVLSSDPDVGSGVDQVASQHLQALLQQHFEARFEPLEGSQHKIHKRQDIRAQSLEDDTESDWTGLSEAEADAPAQVVHYQMSQSSRVDVPKEELKMFMVWVKCQMFLFQECADYMFLQVDKASLYRPPVNIDSQTETA